MQYNAVPSRTRLLRVLAPTAMITGDTLFSPATFQDLRARSREGVTVYLHFTSVVGAPTFTADEKVFAPNLAGDGPSSIGMQAASLIAAGTLVSSGTSDGAAGFWHRANSTVIMCDPFWFARVTLAVAASSVVLAMYVSSRDFYDAAGEWSLLTSV